MLCSFFLNNNYSHNKKRSSWKIGKKVTWMFDISQSKGTGYSKIVYDFSTRRSPTARLTRGGKVGVGGRRTKRGEIKDEEEVE